MLVCSMDTCVSVATSLASMAEPTIAIVTVCALVIRPEIVALSGIIPSSLLVRTLKATIVKFEQPIQKFNEEIIVFHADIIISNDMPSSRIVSELIIDLILLCCAPAIQPQHIIFSVNKNVSSSCKMKSSTRRQTKGQQFSDMSVVICGKGVNEFYFTFVTKTTQSMKKLRKTKLMTNNKADQEKLLTRKIPLVRNLS